MRERGWYVYPDGKRARTARETAVVAFKDSCTPAALRVITEDVDSLEASFAAEADIDPPCPDGLAFRDYQKAGISYMFNRHSSLNADVPRLGKTIQTVGVMNMHACKLNVLVICPAIAKVGWEREVARWQTVEHRIGVAHGDDLPDTDVVILNFELLPRHSDALMSRAWDIVVVDEAHYLGSPKSKRTKLAMNFLPMRHFILLTGTPAFTRPIQLWPMFQKLDPSGLGKNWKTFTRRYCNGHMDRWGRYDYTGYSNLAELQVKMRKMFMVRREKSDVMNELPPMRKTTYLPADGLKKLIKEERAGFQNNLQELLDKISTDAPVEELADLFDNRTDRSAAAKRELALRKIPMVKRYIDELLETEDKVVVFYHHRDPLAAFYESYPPEQIARIWGGISAKQREDERVRFQGDSQCRIMVANLQAASTAIELSAADTVVFAEFSRAVPSEYDQGEERVWLPTKESPVAIHNLVVEGSVEADISEALAYRRGQLERLTCRANI